MRATSRGEMSLARAAGSAGPRGLPAFPRRYAVSLDRSTECIAGCMHARVQAVWSVEECMDTGWFCMLNCRFFFRIKGLEALAELKKNF